MKNKKLNIVIHQPRISYYLGGGEIVPLEQARFLAKLGHRITILTRKSDQESLVFKKFKKDNGRKIKIITLKLDSKFEKLLTEEPGGKWRRWDLEAVFFGKKALSFYSKNLKKIDLIATHMTTDSILLPRSIKNILHLHGEPSRITDIIHRGLIRSNGFVSVSKNVHTFWKKYIKNKPIRLVHNAIDIGKFHPIKQKQDIDILFVGRLIKNKGILDIIEAVKNMKKERVVLIGSGPLKTILLAKIKNKKNIKILSDLSEKKLIKYYQRAKIFVCPSTSKEGVLTTMLEAAASGCAIVTTNCCGMKDFAKNHRNAILVRPNNSKELKSALEKLLTNIKLQLKLSGRAKKDIKKSWNWKKQIKKLEQFYIEICKN